MAECNVCGEDSGLSNNCNYCGGAFCAKHTLPERHNCPALGSTETLGPDFRPDSEDVVIGEDEKQHEDASDQSQGHPEQNPRDADFDSSPDVAKDGSVSNIGSDGDESENTHSIFLPLRQQFQGVTAGQNYQGDCPSCGRWVTRRRADRFTQCQRCGWKAGFPIARIITHWPNWILWKRRGVRWTKRSALVLIILAIAVSTMGATVGTGIDEIDRPSQSLAEQAGVDEFLSALTDDSSSAPANDPDSGGELSTTSQSGIDIETVEELIHEEVNERRNANGLSTLTYSADLVDVARYHSEDMADNEYFAHESPNGEAMEDRYQQFGIGCAGGENIAYTYWEERVETERGTRYYDTEKELARGIVNGWMNSTGHRENILRSRFESEGIGIAVTEVDGQIRVYATQNFC